LQQIETAAAASASQLRLVASGRGTHDQIWHTYGIIERYIPGEVPAMHNARQQRGELNFDPINRVHVPIALASMILALVLLARAIISGRFDATGRLAATVTVAILANAFVCGALSGPHDRYGARIAWIATFTAAIAILRAINKFGLERNSSDQSAPPAESGLANEVANTAVAGAFVASRAAVGRRQKTQ
jgi:hypothetical protein